MPIRLKYNKITAKNLFLIDGIGAFLSMLFLGFVLVRFETIFGIPKQTLYLLASVPVVFFLFDLCCYFTHNRNTIIKLRLIAFSNLSYCLLSIKVLMFQPDSIKPMGWIYFIFEILIVIALAVTELNVSNRIFNTK